jgi:hypothetical protein
LNLVLGSDVGVVNTLVLYLLFVVTIVGGWTMRGRSSSPDRGKNLLHSVQGAHPASYTMSTGGSFPGVKRQRREADHSPLTNAEVNNM